MAELARTHARFFDAIRERGLDDAARRCGGVAAGTGIDLPLLGRPHRVDLAEGKVLARAPDGSWTETGFLESVVMVTYAGTADGTPLSGDWVSEKGLALGDAYFRPPHHLPTARLARAFGDDPGGFVRAAGALGGRETGLGDRGVEIPALPRVPLRFNLWLGDDEFPEPDVRVLLDRNTTHYLILDGVLTLMTLAVKAMLEAGGKA